MSENGECAAVWAWEAQGSLWPCGAVLAGRPPAWPEEEPVRPGVPPPVSGAEDPPEEGFLASRRPTDRRRWQALSVFNKLGRKHRLRPGRRLIVPFTVVHLVVAGESWTDLAKRYYGQQKFAGLLASYNFSRSYKPDPGAQVVIPIGDVRIEPLRLEDLLNERLLGATGEPDWTVRSQGRTRRWRRRTSSRASRPIGLPGDGI